MTSKKVRTMLLSFAILLACLVTCIFGNFTPISAYASTITINGGYTDVLDDLKASENFDADSYKIDKNDYSLQVITIAESENKELFVYVYQPSADSKELVATSLFLSTDVKGLSYKNYYLTLVSNKGVFYKYKVENFFVDSSKERHYEITSIYRAFDSSIDTELEDDNDNSINEVNYKVAKHWVFTSNGKDVEISCQDIDTITITDKYVGYVRYGTATGYNDADLQDRHFVAFSTDKRIDKLLECDIYYKQQTVTTHWRNFTNYPDKPQSFDYGAISEDKYATLTYTSKQDITADYGVWWGNKNYSYSWDAIQTPSDFINSVEQKNVYQGAIFNVSFDSKMTEDGLNNLKDKEWVVSFLTTNYHYDYTGVHFSDDTTTQTLVSNVSIIRLAFETDGYYYNLGVIDNKQTGDGIPDNYTTTEYELTNAGKTLLAILGFIILLLILWPILPLIFQFFGWLIKGIVKIICLPFTAIKTISDKSKKNKQAKTTKKVGKNATGRKKK